MYNKCFRTHSFNYFWWLNRIKLDSYWKPTKIYQNTRSKVNEGAIYHVPVVDYFEGKLFK